MHTQGFHIPKFTSGHASADATKTFADTIWQANPHISPDSWRILDGKTVSKMCFGTLGFSNATQGEQALLNAYNAGCNLFECAASFSHGEDTRSFAQIFTHLMEEENLQRDMCVLISKIPAAPLEIFQETLNAHIKDLNGLTPDYILIQEPELLTLQGFNLEDKNKILQNLMTWLEKESAEGRTQGYGLSSQTFGSNMDDPTHTSLADIHTLARDAAQEAWGRKKRPAFKLISAPLNLIETELFTSKSTWEVNKNGEKTTCSTLDLACRMGLGVITQRPLTALHPLQGPLQLTHCDNAYTGAPSEHLRPYLSHIQSLAHFAQVKGTLEETLEKQDIDMIEKAIQHQNNQQIAPLKTFMEGHIQDKPFHQAAMSTLASIPGVTSIAHSAHKPHQAAEISALMETPDFPYVHEIFTPSNRTK